MATASDSTVAKIVEAVLERTGYLEALEAERTIEARGRIENLEELVGVAREYDAAAEEPSLSRLPAGDLALLRPGRDARRRRRRRPGDADDAAQREGPRVPRRLHARDGGGDLPARALDRGELARGGAAALLRRHDAREGAADADARDAPQPLRPQRGEPAVALPRRAARTRTSSASGCGRRRGRTTAARVQREFAPRDGPARSVDRRHRAPLVARHRDRARDRAGRRRDGAVRGRQRAAADARVRAARADRYDRIDVRPCSSLEELREALERDQPLLRPGEPARGRRAVRAVDRGRADACGVRRTDSVVGGAGAFTFDMSVPGRRVGPGRPV